MGRRERVRAGMLALGLCACFGCDAAGVQPGGDEPVDVTRQEIIDGSRETGLDSVVAIFEMLPGSSAGSLCSGSVIGPYQVMTAKHCVFDEGGRAYPASAFFVVVGSDLGRASSVSSVLRVSDIRTTPGNDIQTDVANGDDIAILLLSNRIGLMPLATSTTTPTVGASVKIVGYGRTMPGVPRQSDAGVKYSGTTAVTSVDSELIQTDGTSAGCEGDSGGPVLDDSGKIIGIISFGLDMNCYGSTLLSTRVARHGDLIAGALAWTPACATPAREICNGMDDNCDGVVDEGCRALGESCSADQQCEGAVCATIDGRDRCTSLCDPSRSISTCTMGSYCREFQCGMGVCVLGAVGTADDGSACSSDTDCASAHCGSANGSRVCGRFCHANEGDSCPMGELCDDSDAAGCGVCIPVELSHAARPFGAPCDRDAQCISSQCLGAGGSGAFCSRPCNDKAPCGNGFHCRDDSCVTGSLGGLGTTCVNAADCAALAPDCAERDGIRACAPACRSGRDCPEGFECSAATDGALHCLRPGAGLGATCKLNAECSTALCSGGRCTRACSASTPCPGSFACEMEAATSPVCVPHAAHDSGGCSLGAAAIAAPAGATSAMPLALSGLLIGLIARRRRRAGERGKAAQ